MLCLVVPAALVFGPWNTHQYGFRCKSTFSYSRATNARVGLAVGRQGGISPLSPLVSWSTPKAPFKIFCHGCLEEERLEVEDDDKLATLAP